MTEPRPCEGRCNARARKLQRDHDEAVRAYQGAMLAWDRARAQLDVVTEAEMLAALDAARPVPPGEADIAWTPGEPIWCPRDRAAIRRALAEVDDLAALLDSWSDGHRGATSGTRTSGSSTPGSPSPIADHLDELWRSLTAVEDDWREARGMPGRPHRAPAEARTRCIGWLLGQLDQILAHPGSIAFGRAAISWQSRLQTLTKSDPVVRRRPGRCPRCDRKGLRTRDDGYTECARCGRLLDEDEYTDIADRQADEPITLDAEEAS